MPRETNFLERKLPDLGKKTQTFPKYPNLNAPEFIFVKNEYLTPKKGKNE